MNNNLSTSKESRIYTSHGEKPQLLGVRAMVNGQLSLAYVKGDKLISYETYEDLSRKLLSGGPCAVFNVPHKE